MTKGVTFHTRDLRILRSVICNRESSILNSFEFPDPMTQFSRDGLHFFLLEIEAGLDSRAVGNKAPRL